MKVHIYTLQKILPVLFICMVLQVKLWACSTPTPSVIGSTKVCVSSIHSYSSFHTGYSSYKWEVVNGIVNKGNGTADAEIIWTKTGLGSVKLIVTDNSGCKDSSITTIFVNSPPTYDMVNAGPDFTVCFDYELILGPTDSFKGYSFEWTDSRYVYLGSPTFKEKNPVLILKPTKHIFTLGYRVKITDSATGCYIYDSVYVKIYSSFKTKISGYAGCFTDTAIYSTDTLPPGAEWRAENGTILSSNKTKNILVKWHRGGTNNLILTYKTGFCKDSTIFAARLDSLKEPEVSGDLIICGAHLHAYEVKEQPFTKITWQFTNALKVYDYGNTKKLVSWDTSKTEGKIIVDMITDFGCKISKVINIEIAKPANASFTANNNVCIKDTVVFIPKDTTQAEYNWSFGDNTTSSEKFPTHSYNIAGTLHATLITKSKAGCTDTFNIYINVKGRPFKPVWYKGNKKVTANTIETYIVNFENGAFAWQVNGGEIISGGFGNQVSVQWGDSIANAYIKVLRLVDGLCPGDTAYMPITISNMPNSISEATLNKAVKIYPNPFHSEITIESDKHYSAAQIVLTDLFGKQIFTVTDHNITDGKSTFNLQTKGLKAGIYFITAYDGNTVIRQKLIKL